jgi:hypothetical protein
MNDLIRDYFKRDLTDHEMEVLEQLLEKSEGARQEFLEASKQAYRQTGLPEPVLPGKVIELKSHKRWLVSSLAAAAVVTVSVSAYFYFQKPTAQSLPGTVMGQGSNYISASTQNLAGQSANQGSSALGSIGFQVNMTDLHVVTVRVEDPDHQEVTKLFSGLLTPGTHDFSWNKCFPNGSPVPKGQYCIVVEHAGAIPTERFMVQVN